MKEIVLAKGAGGALIPLDAQAIEYISALKLGAGVTVTIKRHRNPAFHRKFWALLNLAFDSWEPGDKEYKGERVEKNFDQFRNDVTVLAGHYETAINLHGEVRLTAKSISFANMSQETFEQLYSDTINVILKRILKNYTRDDLDNVIQNLMGFL